jgi:hypothetical protein
MLGGLVQGRRWKVHGEWKALKLAWSICIDEKKAMMKFLVSVWV